MQSTNKRKFRKMNTILAKVLENHDLGHLHVLDEIKEKWKTFDKTIAAHSEPMNYDFNTGTLFLKVNNKMWKEEFVSNHEVLFTKIHNAFRNIKIKNIEIF